jgi:hypothetical protein
MARCSGVAAGPNVFWQAGMIFYALSNLRGKSPHLFAKKA